MTPHSCLFQGWVWSNSGLEGKVGYETDATDVTDVTNASIADADNDWNIVSVM